MSKIGGARDNNYVTRAILPGKLWLRLVTFSGTRRTNKKETYRNKIAWMKMNACSLSNLTRNAFVLFLYKKRNREEQEGKIISCEWWFILEMIRNSVFPFVPCSPFKAIKYYWKLHAIWGIRFCSFPRSETEHVIKEVNWKSTD